MAVKIQQIEYYLPERKVSNSDLKKAHPEWSVEKIEEKSGIMQRFIAEKGETSFDLAKRACEKLFANPAIKKDSIKGIIFCTQSPDFIMPSNAFLLQDYLDLSDDVFAFDYNLACSGYVYGLAISKALIETRVVENVLLVTAETYSKYVNEKDRSTSILFSDAAAVSIVGASVNAESRIIDAEFASSGKDYASFYIPAGGCRIPRSEITSVEKVDQSGNIRSQENIFMNGFGVWKFIAKSVPVQIRKLLDRNSLTVNDLDLIVLHQASKLSLDSIIKSLSFPEEKVYMNLRQVGNCVSASIPIALKDAELEGRLKKGDLVLISGFGVGLSWGSMIMKY